MAQLAQAPIPSPVLPTDFDIAWFYTHRIGYGSVRPESFIVRDLLNVALSKLDIGPLPSSAAFGRDDVEALRLIQSNFSMDRSGNALRLDPSTSERGIPQSGVCGLPTMQLLLKIAGLDSAAMPHDLFIKKTAGKWDLSHLKPDEPQWLASDFPLSPAIRTGLKLPAFRAGVTHIAQKYGLSEDDLLRIILFESGGDPTAANRSGARGYIQFMPKTRARLAHAHFPFTTDPIAQLKLVDAFLSGEIQTKSAFIRESADLYTAILAPHFVGRENLYSAPSREYTSNKFLDFDGDGVITRKDLKAILALYWFPGLP